MMEFISVVSGLLDEKSLGMLTELVSAATDPARTGPSDPYRFTFWYGNTSDPRNAVEQVIRYRLSAQVPESVSSQAAGVEWWLGRLAPPYARNFGPGTHRDMGENPDSHELESPLLSSVFYLTTVDDGA